MSTADATRPASGTSAGGAAQRAARGLGIFSIGLGLAELLAPNACARAIGLSGRETLVRAYGLRDIVGGLALVAAKDPRPWLWAGVAGSALGAAPVPRGATAASGGGRALGLAATLGTIDLVCALMADAGVRRERTARLDYSGRVGFARSPDAMRGAARDFEVPRDMRTPEALRPYPTA